MNIYNDDILQLLLFSLALGLISGIVYDILHSLVFVVRDSQTAKAKKLYFTIEYISLFLADILFCLFFGLGALILMYNLNKGVFRCTVYILMGSGFILYRVTVSKIIRKLLSFVLTVFGWISRIIYRVVNIPIRLIFKIYHLTIGKIVCIIICGIKNKRGAKWQKKRERALIAVSNSGKEEYVASPKNKKNKRKKRIFIRRKATRDGKW